MEKDKVYEFFRDQKRYHKIYEEYCNSIQNFLGDALSRGDGLAYALAVEELGRTPEDQDLYNQGMNQLFSKNKFNRYNPDSLEERRKTFAQEIKKYESFTPKEEKNLLGILYTRLSIGGGEFLGIEYCKPERVHEVFQKECIKAMKYLK